jgi:predicted MFS family arabinose efflux permease
VISYGTTQYLFSLLIEPVRAEFGVGRATLGIAYAGSILVAGAVGIALAPALDRWGARWLLAGGSLISAIALAALAYAPSAAAFTAEWAVGMGVGAALTWYSVSFTVVANWFHRERARALARLTFMGAFSSTIFYPLSAALIAHYGWRGALLALALVQLLIAVPLHALVVRRHPEDRGLHPDGDEAAAAGPQSGLSAPVALRTTAFWLVTAAIALSAFATTAVLVVHVAFLTSRGYPVSTAASIAALLGIAYIPGRWLFGRLAERVRLGRLLAATIALEAVAVMVLAAERGIGWVALYIVAFGMAYGAMAPLRGALIASLFGRRAYGTIFAAQGVGVALAAAAGPIVLAAVADARGYGASLWCAAVALTFGAVVAAVPLRPPVAGDARG